MTNKEKISAVFFGKRLWSLFAHDATYNKRQNYLSILH